MVNAVWWISKKSQNHRALVLVQYKKIRISKCEVLESGFPNGPPPARIILYSLALNFPSVSLALVGRLQWAGRVQYWSVGRAASLFSLVSLNVTSARSWSSSTDQKQSYWWLSNSRSGPFLVKMEVNLKWIISWSSSLDFQLFSKAHFGWE